MRVSEDRWAERAEEKKKFYAKLKRREVSRINKAEDEARKYRKNLDRASARKRFHLIVRIFCEVPGRIDEVIGWTKQAPDFIDKQDMIREMALKLIDRDDLWVKMGLLVNGSYVKVDGELKRKISLLDDWPGVS